MPGSDGASANGARRTHLASERTLLAWWRSGLAAVAVALAVGRLLPALLHVSSTPFVVLGIGFAVLALSFILYGTLRQRQVDRAIAAGGFRPLDAWFVLLLTALMVILVTATIALTLIER
jgi:putative membrane protein